MKKIITIIAFFPTVVFGHSGGAHSHPEELTGGLILLAALGLIYYLWKNKNN